MSSSASSSMSEGSLADEQEIQLPLYPYFDDMCDDDDWKLDIFESVMQQIKKVHCKNLLVEYNINEVIPELDALVIGKGVFVHDRLLSMLSIAKKYDLAILKTRKIFILAEYFFDCTAYRKEYDEREIVHAIHVVRRHRLKQEAKAAIVKGKKAFDKKAENLRTEKAAHMNTIDENYIVNKTRFDKEFYTTMAKMTSDFKLKHELAMAEVD